MKIAIFTETFLPQVNGIVRTLEKVIKYLESQGHEVLMIAIGEGESSYSNTPILRVDGAPFTLYKELHIVKPEDKLMRKLVENDLSQVPIAALLTLIPTKHSEIETVINDFKPDLIHLVTPVTLGAIGYYYVSKLQVPCLATFHTDLAAYAPMYQWPYMEEVVNTVTKLIYEKADKTLAPSPSSKKQLEALGLKDVGVFGRGVDTELFNPAKANKQILANYGLDPNKLTIMYAGRLAEEKAIDEVITAFKNLLKSNDNIQLLLVGDGPIREKLAKELKDTPHAFTGVKKGNEYAELHACADIFAFASKTETFGQVVLEAMASASAVLCYDAQGVRDLINHEQSGLLATLATDTAANTLNFEAQLRRFVEDTNLREKCSGEAVKEAQLRSWNEILAGLLAEYEKLVSAKLAAV